MQSLLVPLKKSKENKEFENADLTDTAPKSPSYQQMNNLLHGKKYKKRYAKKSKDGSAKKVEYNYIAAPKFKKCTDYIVRGGFIYISEEIFEGK